MPVAPSVETVQALRGTLLERGEVARQLRAGAVDEQPERAAAVRPNRSIQEAFYDPIHHFGSRRHCRMDSSKLR